jgi:hypothetical protein
VDSDLAVAFAVKIASTDFHTANSIRAELVLVTCTRRPLSETLYCG